jgi:hypothetical protein
MTGSPIRTNPEGFSGLWGAHEKHIDEAELIFQFQSLVDTNLRCVSKHLAESLL